LRPQEGGIDLFSTTAPPSFGLQIITTS
jgi:hypothetical protein